MYDWSEYGHPLISFTHLSNWGKCPEASRHYTTILPLCYYSIL